MLFYCNDRTFICPLQDRAKDAIAQAEQQREQTKQLLEEVEQRSHNLDCLLKAQEQNSKEILRQAQVTSALCRCVISLDQNQSGKHLC